MGKWPDAVRVGLGGTMNGKWRENAVNEVEVTVQ